MEIQETAHENVVVKEQDKPLQKRKRSQMDDVKDEEEDPHKLKRQKTKEGLC